MPIHPTAIVHPKAELASDVDVQAFSIIDEKVTIGAGTVVGPHCVITGDTILGERNQLYSNAQVGIPPQDLKHRTDVYGKTIIGDDNVIRETVTISSGTVYQGDEAPKTTHVGSNCLFMACSHVAHDCIVGSGVILANQVCLAGHAEVQDKAILGGLAGVHQFTVVGAMAYVGAMAKITKDVLPYMLVEGGDPKCYGPNRVGLERNGFDKDTIGQIRAMYKILSRGGLNTTQALAKIEAEIPASEPRDLLLSFIRNSKRGVIL